MYVFITWLLINLLHPIALTIYFNSGDGLFKWEDFSELYFPVLMYSLLCSIPSLILSYGTIYLIKRATIPDEVIFLIWFITACLITFLNFIIVFGFVLGSFRWNDLTIAIPGASATALVILIRYNYFIKMLRTKDEVLTDE